MSNTAIALLGLHNKRPIVLDCNGGNCRSISTSSQWTVTTSQGLGSRRVVNWEPDSVGSLL